MAASGQECGNVRDLLKGMTRALCQRAGHTDAYRTVVINVWSETQAWSGGSARLPSCCNAEGENGKVEVKLTLEQVTKAQRGGRGIAVLFL